MARARNIKPGLFRNEVLGVADPIYTLAFEGLWIYADREGRLEDRPMRLKADIFPYRDVRMEDVLGWLQQRGFIVRYRVKGAAYIEIVNFAKHQNPHVKEAPSAIPSPSEADPEEEPATAQNHASTVQAQCENGASTSAALRIPDSGFRIPDTGSLIPDPLTHKATAPESGRAEAAVCVSEAGRICFALKRAGVSDVNPGHPTLNTLLKAGATVDEFLGAAKTGEGKGFAYVLGIVAKQRTRAADIAQKIVHGPLSPNPVQNTPSRNKNTGAGAAIYAGAFND